MVTRLASLLRYGLQHDRAHTVPLAQEIENISAYLELEAVRFEDRLRVSIHVDPATTAIEIPAMLLKTLVENTLKTRYRFSPGWRRGSHSLPCWRAVR